MNRLKLHSVPFHVRHLYAEKFPKRVLKLRICPQKYYILVIRMCAWKLNFHRGKLKQHSAVRRWGYRWESYGINYWFFYYRDTVKAQNLPGITRKWWKLVTLWRSDIAMLWQRPLCGKWVGWFPKHTNRIASNIELLKITSPKFLEINCRHTTSSLTGIYHGRRNSQDALFCQYLLPVFLSSSMSLMWDCV